MQITPHSATTQARQQFKSQFPPLEQVTKPVLTTAEIAFYTNTQPQTWRAYACYDNAPGGLRPLRIGGRLCWPTACAKKLLLGVSA